MGTSTQSGKKKGQKHQNTFAYVPSKHNPRIMKIAEIEIVLCCPKCVEILQFKQRIGKYKPLSQPGKCVKCQQRTVLNAYHATCKACATRHGECAKCHIKMEHEEVKDESKDAKIIEEHVKNLSERLRRTYYRKIKDEKYEDAQMILDSRVDNSDGDESGKGEISSESESKGNRECDDADFDH